MKDIVFVALLYLSPGERSLNMSPERYNSQLEVYIRNANLLGMSIGGGLLTVLTNDVETISKRIGRYYGKEASFKLRSCEFNLVVPKSIRFYAAHFKVEAYKLAANIFTDRYIVFLDLDMVALSDVCGRIDEINPRRLPMVYSIIDQVAPVYGRETISRDLELLVGAVRHTDWFGGEFLAGSPQFFLNLYCNIIEVLPRYLAALETLHHVGDEALTTAALLLYPADSGVIDAGSIGLIRRHWSGVTLHPQPRLSLRGSDVGLLHLPQDKGFLADQDAIAKGQQNFSAQAFISTLRRYLIKRRMRAIFVKTLRAFRRKFAR